MWAFLAVVLLVNNAAGSVLPQARSSVDGGDNAPEGRWPWMTSLWITNGIGTWQCGGSLLTEEWVLTAAHCLRRNILPPLPRFSFARLGTIDLEKPSEIYHGLSEFVLHPDYENIHHDIALVKLEEKVTFTPLVSPVLLPVKGEVFRSKAECWVTGWGSKFYFQMNLQELRVPIIKQNVCEDLVQNLTSSMICAGTQRFWAGVCDEDVGSPLVCRSACGFVQVGITSGQTTDSEACTSGSPGVYTRVSRYLDFINNIAHNNLEASAEV